MPSAQTPLLVCRRRGSLAQSCPFPRPSGPRHQHDRSRVSRRSAVGCTAAPTVGVVAGHAGITGHVRYRSSSGWPFGDYGLTASVADPGARSTVCWTPAIESQLEAGSRSTGSNGKPRAHLVAGSELSLVESGGRGHRSPRPPRLDRKPRRSSERLSQHRQPIGGIAVLLKPHTASGLMVSVSVAVADRRRGKGCSLSPNAGFSRRTPGQIPSPPHVLAGVLDARRDELVEHRLLKSAPIPFLEPIQRSKDSFGAGAVSARSLRLQPRLTAAWCRERIVSRKSRQRARRAYDQGSVFTRALCGAAPVRGAWECGWWSRSGWSWSRTRPATTRETTCRCRGREASSDGRDVQAFPDQANGTISIVTLHAKSGKLTDSSMRPRSTCGRPVAKEPFVASVMIQLTSEGASALSKDQCTGYLSVTTSVNPDPCRPPRPRRSSTVPTGEGGRRGGSERRATRPEGLDALDRVERADRHHRRDADLDVHFRAIVAMVLPILTAIFALASTLAIIRLLGHVLSVPTVAPTLATMIGFGVGIDYALFIVTRHFRGLTTRIDVDESIARSVATSGGAVFFAGATVTIALASLAVAGIPLVTTMGLMAAIAVVVAVPGCAHVVAGLLASSTHINSLRFATVIPAASFRRRTWASGLR